MASAYHMQVDRLFNLRLDAHHELLLSMSQSLKTLEQTRSITAVTDTKESIQRPPQDSFVSKHAMQAFDRSYLNVTNHAASFNISNEVLQREAAYDKDITTQPTGSPPE